MISVPAGRPRPQLFLLCSDVLPGRCGDSAHRQIQTPRSGTGCRAPPPWRPLDAPSPPRRFRRGHLRRRRSRYAAAMERPSSTPTPSGGRVRTPRRILVSRRAPLTRLSRSPPSRDQAREEGSQATRRKCIRTSGPATAAVVPTMLGRSSWSLRGLGPPPNPDPPERDRLSRSAPMAPPRRPISSPPFPPRPSAPSSVAICGSDGAAEQHANAFGRKGPYAAAHLSLAQSAANPAIAQSPVARSGEGGRQSSNAEEVRADRGAPVVAASADEGCGSGGLFFSPGNAPMPMERCATGTEKVAAGAGKGSMVMVTNQ